MVVADGRCHHHPAGAHAECNQLLLLPMPVQDLD
jgi:hypothetical protein